MPPQARREPAAEAEPRRQEERPPYWVARTDIPGPGAEGYGGLAPIAYRAGQRVSVAAVERNGWREYVDPPGAAGGGGEEA